MKRLFARVLPWLLAPLFVVASARADGDQDAAAAEHLFRDGRTLLSQGRVREACEKFSESHRLDPAPGTMLNLAQCYEELGRTASAWAAYRELESRAQKLGQTPRAEFARQKAAALEPSLPSLVVHVPVSHRLEGLSVDYDGTSLGAAGWDSRVPVDPGAHRVTARAPGYRSWSSTFEVAPSKSVQVDIPLLVREVETSPVTPAPPKSLPSRTNPLRLTGIVTTIVGAAAVGTGLVLGGVAKAKNDSAHDDECNAAGCSREGLAQIGRADDFASAATFTTVTGLSLAAIGVVLWIISPSSATRAPTVAGGTF